MKVMLDVKMSAHPLTSSWCLAARDGAGALRRVGIGPSTSELLSSLGRAGSSAEPGVSTWVLGGTEDTEDDRAIDRDFNEFGRHETDGHAG